MCLPVALRADEVNFTLGGTLGVSGGAQVQANGTATDPFYCPSGCTFTYDTGGITPGVQTNPSVDGSYLGTDGNYYAPYGSHGVPNEEVVTITDGATTVFSGLVGVVPEFVMFTAGKAGQFET